MFNRKPAGTQRLAVALAYAYQRTLEAERPIDKKVAEAKLAGMCKAANDVGYGRTESHVRMMVQGFMIDHPKPEYNAMDGSARIAWEDAAAHILASELEDSK
jgi:hypothetical protein